MTTAERQPLGAHPLPDGRTRFRVWAPDRRRVAVAIESKRGLQRLPLEPEAGEAGEAGTVPEGACPKPSAPSRETRNHPPRNHPHTGGYFQGIHPVPVGTRYRYCLDDGECFPDPCSRFQPEGPHGPSQVVDPSTFIWSDSAWCGPTLKGQVLYELHVGTFTPEGTYRGVQARLPHLKEVGITALELMPLNTCAGNFNWGYDGVSLFAPSPSYGSPDELRALVDEAHRLGLSVLLDVVYNHLGPDGNWLPQFARAYFTDRYKNDWGQPLRFEGPEGRPVREFFLQNVRMWIEEYHFDGLRLDATQNLYDASERHILTELINEARVAASPRQVLIVAENEPQDRRTIQPESQGGHGGDLLWVDDFHHSARVAMTGNSEAYCQDYCGTSQELLSCVLRNSLYQGQHYAWQKQGRGTPLLDAPAERAVFYLQNHDQLANTLRAMRFQQVAGEDVARAMTVFLLLLPQTPMLFQGQEFFSTSPFLFFVDHKAELMPLIQKGRDGFLSQFETARHALESEGHRVPIDRTAFERSRLDWAERDRNERIVRLHRDALALRRQDPLFSAQDLDLITGATLSPRALVLRWSAARQQRKDLSHGTAHPLGSDPDPIRAEGLPPLGRSGVLRAEHEPPLEDGRQRRTPRGPSGGLRAEGEPPAEARGIRAGERGDRLLLLNLGPDLRFEPCPEPLLAPLPGSSWRALLSSQHSSYGGAGARAPTGDGPWLIPGHCALALTTEENPT